MYAFNKVGEIISEEEKIRKALEASEQFSAGVSASERLVAAAAGYVAEDGRAPNDQHPAVGRLMEAADLLRGVADGLSELRGTAGPARPAI